MCRARGHARALAARRDKLKSSLPNDRSSVLTRTAPSAVNVDRLIESERSSVPDPFGGQLLNVGSGNCGTHELSACGRDDVDVDIAAGKEAVSRFGQHAVARGVQDSQITPGSESCTHQRFIGGKPTSRRPSSVSRCISFNQSFRHALSIWAPVGQFMIQMWCVGASNDKGKQRWNLASCCRPILFAGASCESGLGQTYRCRHRESAVKDDCARIWSRTRARACRPSCLMSTPDY
jgi:hypothetical protein